MKINRAAYVNKTRLPKGKYRSVYGYVLEDGSLVYHASIPKYRWSKYFNNERDAAIAVDVKRLEEGGNAINILTYK